MGGKLRLRGGGKPEGQHGKILFHSSVIDRKIALSIRLPDFFQYAQRRVDPYVTVFSPHSFPATSAGTPISEGMVLLPPVQTPTSMPKTATSAKAAQKTPAPEPKSKATTPGTEGIDAGLRDLFLSELQDIYWGENQLVKALPKMQSAASSGKLAEAIATHWEQTQNQVARLEEVFGILGETPRAKKCFAMEGLTREGEGVVETTVEGSATRDAGIIIASQKVEHYEIAAYGGLVQLARTLGLEDAASLLEQTLNEEKETDLLLTGIAENDINYQAAGEA